MLPNHANILLATEVENDPITINVLSKVRNVEGTFFYATNELANQTIREAKIRPIETGSAEYRDQISTRYWDIFMVTHKINHLVICDGKRRGKRRPASIRAVLAAATARNLTITFI